MGIHRPQRQCLEAAGVPTLTLESRAEGGRWAVWAEEVPALGWQTYQIERHGPAGAAGAREASARGADRPEQGARLLENDDYRIVVDPVRGGITELWDKQLARDLLDGSGTQPLGQVIYERLDDRMAMERRELGGHRRESWSDLRIEGEDDGPLWHSLRLRGRLEGFEDLALEIRLYKPAKRVELLYRGRKQRVFEPEGVYVVLPFDLPDGHLEFEAQGGAVVPGVDQLPGTASDWNTIQAYAAVRSPQGEIIVVSDEAPLVQFGAINTGRYAYDGRPASNRIFSWVLNNYWVTNFCAGQEGELRWSYQITSTPAADRSAATRFGWSVRVPLIPRVRPAAAGPASGSAPPRLGLEAPNLLLVAARPAAEGRGVFLHLRETGGREVSLPGEGASARLRWQRVNALGEPLDGDLRIPPLGARFFEVTP